MSSADSILGSFKPDEGWADRMVADLEILDIGCRACWEALLRHCADVRPQEPATIWEVSIDEVGGIEQPDYQRLHAERVLDRRCSLAWKDEANLLIDNIGREIYGDHLRQWLDLVPKSRPGYLSRQSPNRETLRGLLWSLPDQIADDFASTIAVAADFFFKKSSPLGVPCVAILSKLGTMNAMAQLTVLAGRVKAGVHKRLVQSARERIADAQGIPVDELDDLSIPQSGFTEPGRRREVLSGFTGEVVIQHGSAELKWWKPNGQPQASVPASVKREHSKELKDLQRAAKEAETTLHSLATRFEAAPLCQRSWSFADWRSRYFDHPIAGTMVRRLLWVLSVGDVSHVVACSDNGLVDADGKAVVAAEMSRLSLWHPLTATADEVAAWRSRLESQGIRQPFKQAHREVYVLTDAEQATRTYSNRFASHILRQSQFRALAKGRGWSSSYIGPWDAGGEGMAELSLPQWKLRAELWVNDAGHEQTETGVETFVATDQIRFYNTERPQDPLPMEDVPPLVLSEVFRDVDLFVGVASVGNDPHWLDGGPDGRHQTYWNDYSFGELSQTAATRKAVLERLVPRLKIADRCRIDGRFLIVRGDRRTYKIHLGSSNILTEPNDQYLCIVPARGSAADDQLDFTLPFEGDRKLSVILSKAFLLAADTEIDDPTIISQISR